jgi:hypothetical protein
MYINAHIHFEKINTSSLLQQKNPFIHSIHTHFSFFHSFFLCLSLLYEPDAVNILSLSLTSATRTSASDIGAHINQIVDKNDFTIMLTIRSKVGGFSLSVTSINSCRIHNNILYPIFFLPLIYSLFI